MDALAQQLDQRSSPGQLYESLSNGDVRCHACAHRCLIKPGGRGICMVRFNRDGILMVPWGYVAALQVDPIEKKPLYHFLPGEAALTFGMLGCDFHCDYCQNWVTSQALRDDAARVSGRYIRGIDAESIIAYGQRMGATVVASSYNEPLITAEWAHAIFERAQAAGMKSVFISNGFATPETLDFLKPVLDGYKVDLKSMRPEVYRDLGGRLQPVLDTIRAAYEREMWVEVVTLVVPGLNDSIEELMSAARYISSISPDIPWHVTAFHRDYRMTDRDNTSSELLLRAAEIGQEAGLKYVYAGNLPGVLSEYEHSYCPQCQVPVIERRGFFVTGYHLDDQGCCPQCGTQIPGVWLASAGVQVSDAPGFTGRHPQIL